MAPKYRSILLWLLAAGVGFATGVGAALIAWNVPAWRYVLRSEPGAARANNDHDHEAPEPSGAATSLELSDQGRKNIGLAPVTVALSDFQRTIAVPAVLTERPGHSAVTVAAPMTGIVTRVFPIRGEAVAPGEPLFELRLTHEDLVDKQSALLRVLEELDVVRREIARLERVTASGAVAGRKLLERQYEQRKIEAVLRASREALRLHGLTKEQVEEIVVKRRLVSTIRVDTPAPSEAHAAAAHEDLFQVADLPVGQGEHVTTGAPLALLSDHCELYIEGRAFAQDAEVLNRAANQGIEVTALVETGGTGRREVGGLRIFYVENQVERESRALKFYVTLPNEMIRNEKTSAGHRFIAWRYRPGQRVELLVPVEKWENRIVLPIEAVIQEGTQWLVYRQAGNRFDRRAVHVEYRDRRSAVIENDGTLFPGDVVAGKGAYQIHLELKNKAGGGVDPHAGHHH